MLTTARRRRGREPDFNPNLSIPGFSTITDSREPALVRIVFAVTLFACTYVCVNQTWERIDCYFSYPVTLEYEIKQLDVIAFPMVTVCSYFEANDKDKFVESHGHHDHHAHHDLSGILSNCTYDMLKSCMEFWTPTLTTGGRCYSLHLQAKVEYIGPASAIRLDMFPLSRHQHEHIRVEFTGLLSWKLLIHEHLEEAVYGVEMDGHEIYQATSTGMYYTHKRFLYKNTPNRPCHTKSVVASCILNCYDRAVVKISNCSLPYTTTLDGTTPPCTDDAVIFASHSRNVRLSDDLCDYCGRPCVEDNYEIQADSRDEVDSVNETVIWIMPTREELEILEEVEAYVLYALVCDVGGILGLYLGVCILTLIEVVEFFVQRGLVRSANGRPYVRR